jgi:hypothetical protein
MKKKSKPDRRERDPAKYQLSRYVPFVQDLMEVTTAHGAKLFSSIWEPTKNI